MNGFFKSLRRKLGVVTLGIALLFAAVWVRSIIVCDNVRLRPDDATVYQFASCGGRLALESREAAIPRKTQQAIRWTQFPVRHIESLGVRNGRTNWYWQVFGTDICTTSEKITGRSRTNVEVWYGSIVIPLTLISAWGLLSKPHSSPPKKIEAIPEKAA